MSLPKPKGLKQRALSAGGWSFAGYGASLAIRFGSNLVMTRLLVPEMFGVMAIATMVTIILGLLSDLGVRQNIVQSRRSDDPAFLNTAWVFSIIRGGVLWTIALALATLLHLANLGGILPEKSVYASQVLPLVIAVSSFSVVIAGFQSTKMATAQRGFDQMRITQIELIGQLAGLMVMVTIGVINRSIWSLVSGGVVATLTTTLLSHAWMKGQANCFHWEKSAFQELIGFGKWIIASSAVGVLTFNGDRLLLGGLIGADVFGVYSIAVLIIGAVEGGMNKFISTVSLPVLSEIARTDPSRLREVYYKLRVPSDLLALFLTGLLFAVGQSVIDLLYDPRYGAAGGMLQILAFTLVPVRYGIAHQVYLALGLPRHLTIISLVRFVSLFTILPVSYYFGGLHAALWGIALHSLVPVPLVFLFNARLGLNDFRRELIVLVALPIGFLCGSLITMLSETVK